MAKISGAAAYQQLKPIGNYIADSANKAADRAAANMRNQSNINSKEKDAQLNREEAEKVREENARIEAEKKKNVDLDAAQTKYQAYGMHESQDAKNHDWSNRVGAAAAESYEEQKTAIANGDTTLARKLGDKLFNINQSHKNYLKVNEGFKGFVEAVEGENTSSFVIQNSQGVIDAANNGGITPKLNEDDGGLYLEFPVKRDGKWENQSITGAEVENQTPAVFDEFIFPNDIKDFNANLSKDVTNGNYSWTKKNERQLDSHLEILFVSDHTVKSAIGQQPDLYEKLGWERGNLSNLSREITDDERDIVKEYYKGKYKDSYSSKYTTPTSTGSNTGTGTWNVTTTEEVEAPANGVDGMDGKGTGKTFLFPSKTKGNLLGIAGVGKNGETLNEIWVNRSGTSFGLFMKPLTERNTSNNTGNDEGAGFDLEGGGDSGKTTTSLSVKKGETEWRKMTSGELSKYRSQTTNSGGASIWN